VIYVRPAWPTDTNTVPAEPSWAQDAWGQITGTGGIAITATLTAALLGGLAVYLLMRRPRRADFSKHLMYVPLLLVNAAAIYGQVAFFYEQVAPATWPVIGKLALAVLIAAAVESIAVYVGWHAHDALLNKAGATAARLRRASYLIALIVGGINYAHFAANGMLGLQPTAASVAFGLLSLLSPWLWGLHTRRIQHIQLTREGAVDVTGVQFSSERIRMYPVRAFMARRWSIDKYVTDPQRAWEGYNAERDARRALTRTSRVRGAWLVLSGRAGITPGTMPAVRVDSTVGTDPEKRPAIEPDTRPDSALGATDGHPADTNPDGQPDTRNGAAPTRMSGRPARPKTTAMPTQNRASNPGVGRASTPTSAQLKAFKLRQQQPGITWAQLAAKVGKNERTVRRWFEAQRPATDTEEQAPAPAPMPAAPPTFDLPTAPTTDRVNGSRPHLEETRS
jgi:hypothetical protein